MPVGHACIERISRLCNVIPMPSHSTSQLPISGLVCLALCLRRCRLLHIFRWLCILLLCQSPRAVRAGLRQPFQWLRSLRSIPSGGCVRRGPPRDGADMQHTVTSLSDADVFVFPGCPAILFNSALRSNSIALTTLFALHVTSALQLQYKGFLDLGKPRRRPSII